MYFVTNKTKGVISIPLDGEEKNLQLAPGSNPVPDKLWEKAKKIHMIGVKIETDDIDDSVHTEDPKEPTPKGETKPHPLAALKAKDLRTTIKNTFNEAQLIAWLEDAPSEIAKLLEAQQKALKKSK